MKFDDKIPIYYQIKNYIYRQIIIGELAPGDKLPAVRQLAVDLTVNVNTVQRALGVPVKFVGLGEGADDLAPFDPQGFVDAIVGSAQG